MQMTVKLKENRDIIQFNLIICLNISLRGASIWSDKVVVQD